jgi:hypothetical protein
VIMWIVDLFPWPVRISVHRAAETARPEWSLASFVWAQLAGDRDDKVPFDLRRVIKTNTGRRSEGLSCVAAR